MTRTTRHDAHLVGLVVMALLVATLGPAVVTQPAGATAGDCPVQTLTIDNDSVPAPDPAFNTLIGVATDPGGNIYAVDANPATIHRFDSSGTQTLTVNNASTPAPNPAFNTLFAVAAGPGGNVYTVDRFTQTAYRFDSTGTQTLAINNASTPAPNPAFQQPNGVATDNAGNIYVADYDFAVDTVYRFDSTGTQTLAINNASATPPDPAFVDPVTVAADLDGNIYVADIGSATIFRFDSTGTQTLAINSASATPPDPAFILPYGVAADADGNIYVADRDTDTVYRFDPSGTQTLAINSATVPAPDPALNDPIGVAADADGSVYVADQGSNTIYRFATDCSPATPRPDGRIKKGSGTFVGNDVYNTTGTGQTRTARVARGATVTYTIKVQNDAAVADTLRLKGTRSSTNYRVTYTAGTNDITAEVNAGTYTTPELAPGATFTIRAVVKVKATAPTGSSLTGSVTATSTTDPTVKDKVKFVTSRA